MADIQDVFKEAWSQALSGVNVAEQEAERVLAKLADAAGFTADDVKRHAREFGERLGSQRRELEKTIDEGVRRAANRFRIPSREDIDALSRRVDVIAERVDALARDQEKQA